MNFEKKLDSVCQDMEWLSASHDIRDVIPDDQFDDLIDLCQRMKMISPEEEYELLTESIQILSEFLGDERASLNYKANMLIRETCNRYHRYLVGIDFTFQPRMGENDLYILRHLGKRIQGFTEVVDDLSITSALKTILDIDRQFCAFIDRVCHTCLD